MAVETRGGGTMTSQEFPRAFPISASLPWIFESGARWERFVGRCGECDDEIPEAEIRGCVVQHGTTFVLDALGYCADCHLFTTFRFRFHADLTITGVRDGKWVRWSAHRDVPTWVHWLALALAIVAAIVVAGR